MPQPSRTCAFGASSKAAYYSLPASYLKTFWQLCMIWEQWSYSMDPLHIPCKTKELHFHIVKQVGFCGNREGYFECGNEIECPPYILLQQKMLIK